MKLKRQQNSKPKQFSDRAERCLNCGQHLDISDRFCSYCGQKNSSKTLSLKELLLEFFSGLISYDSRFRKSLSALACSPGKLSEEYIEGKRVKYVNPFRFFISTAIVFFLMVSWINRDELLEVKGLPLENRKENSEIFKSELGFKENSVAAKITDYVQDHTQARYSEAMVSLKLEESLTHRIMFDFIYGYNRLVEDPAGFINFLLPKLPFFLFFFIPIFTLFSWLLYLRNKTAYVHHLIFNYNQQTVYLILLFLAFIIDYVSLWIWLLLYIFYLYKSMRRFYRQSRFKTLLKQMILMLCYTLSSVVVITTLALVSIIFF